jgi:hypothetical protein
VTVINDCSDLKDALSTATTTEAGSSAANAISGSSSTSSEAEKSFLALVDAYFALSVDKDLPFLRWVITTKNLDTKTNIEKVVKTLSQSSFLAGFPLTSTSEYLVAGTANNANASQKISYLVMIGLVYWYCHECQPTAAKRFHLYMQQLYESATEDQTEFVESALLSWELLSFQQFKKYLPSSYKRDKIDLTLVETDKEEEEKEKQYKESKVRCKQLLELVKSEEEEEEEDEDDEEED